jgi:hypothetical protein
VLVESAVQRTLASSADLVRDTAAAVPKAWGALAARGIVTFREITGRPPTDDERRAIWSALWNGVHRLNDPRGDSGCAHLIDESHHAICGVCGGVRLCLECARAHFCTGECGDRGCTAGLCVREVRDGVLASRYGIA